MTSSWMKGDVFMRFIGSKNLLLNEIHSMLEEKLDGSERVFFDLFAGANVVGEHFKKTFEIKSNDILYFSFCYAKAVIENNKAFSFNGLEFNPFDYLNDENQLKAYSGDFYYTNAYTPVSDDSGMYFTIENGQRIDFIRETIEAWYLLNKITDYERFYLIACLIEAVSLVSNTTGTYGAYLKHWDKRALKTLKLKPLPVLNNNLNNTAFNVDSNELVKKEKADIVYIDTPYNNRQYASNYHVLENIATHNKPKLTGKTKIFDWSDKRSNYAMRSKALKAMEDLLKNINTKHIILSYNDEGIIPIDDLKEILAKNAYDGLVDVRVIPYKKYKSKIPSKKAALNEYLFYIRKVPVKNIISKPQQLKLTKWEPKQQGYIKSPLNYIGGKYRLLKQIIPLFPTNIDTFLDLFSGGANVGINANANRYIFNDMNTRINEMFRYFSKQNTEELIVRIKEIISEKGLSKTNEEAYLSFRRQYNENPHPLMLYILVSYSYNYQIRFNNSMEFNNPFGRNRSHFSKNMENNLRRFNNRLQEISFEFTDNYFENINFTKLTEKDFVYLDPPYLITTGSYNDGNRGFQNWRKEQELLMYEIMDNLTTRNIRYALSNVLTHKGETNEFLLNYIKNRNVSVHYLDYNYNNASYNSKNKGSSEVLITNYDPITQTINKDKKISLSI